MGLGPPKGRAAQVRARALQRPAVAPAERVRRSHRDRVAASPGPETRRRPKLPARAPALRVSPALRAAGNLRLTAAPLPRTRPRPPSTESSPGPPTSSTSGCVRSCSASRTRQRLAMAVGACPPVAVPCQVADPAVAQPVTRSREGDPARQAPREIKVLAKLAVRVREHRVPGRSHQTSATVWMTTSWHAS